MSHASTSTTAGAGNGEDSCEESLTELGQVADFGVRVQTEHSWLLHGKLLLDVVSVLLTLELGGIGALETRLKSHLHLGHNLGTDDNLEVSPVGTSIPVISNMTTVHDLTIDVSEILVGHLVVLAKIVVQYITANGQITIIEGVEFRPSLRAELSATKDQGMEHNKTEDKGLELVVLVLSSLLIVFFIKLGDGTAQVSLQILRSLVGNFDRVLQDGLWNNFHGGDTGRLRRDEASEVRMWSLFNSHFESTLKFSHPLSHQMHILDHEPISFARSILEGIHCDLLLTLSHGNVGEGLFMDSFALNGTNTLDIGSRIYTREQDEEGWSSDSHFVVNYRHVERWLLNILDTK